MFQFLRDAIGYMRHRGITRAARRLWQSYLFDRRRIYLTRHHLGAMAQWPIDTQGYEVRLARPDDPIAESFPHLPPSTIAAWQRADYLLFVTVHRGQLVAYRSVSTNASPWVAPFQRRRPDQICGIMIYIRPEFRRQGLTRITRVGVARHLVARGFFELLGTESPLNHRAIIADDRVGLTRLGTLTRTCVLGHVRFWATPATTLAPPLVRRQLELLGEIAPMVSRVGVLFNPSVVMTSPEAERATRRSAAELGTEVTFLPVREAVDQVNAVNAALSTAREARVDGLIVLSDPMTKDHCRALVSLVSHNRLPAIFDAREFVAVGGLMSGEIPAPVLHDFESLVAAFDMSDASGHTSAGVPGEPNVAVNRNTAAALGLAVPPDLQARSPAVRVARAAPTSARIFRHGVRQ